MITGFLFWNPPLGGKRGVHEGYVGVCSATRGQKGYPGFGLRGLDKTIRPPEECKGRESEAKS